MAVQITGRQIANSAVDVNKLDLSTGTFDFTSAVLQVAAPSNGSDAATKTYVDSIAQGLHWKDSVRVATTADITLSGTQTIDGIAVVADQRVLVKSQTDQTENGIYLCKSGSWVRADDMDASSEFSGAAVFVQEGTANADTGYVCSNDGDVTIGTDNITFVQFTGAGQLDGGNGIDITGSTVSVDLDSASGLAVSASGLKIDAAGVTNAMLAGSIENAKLSNSSVSFGGVSLSLGGSDATPAFDLSDATNYPAASLTGTIANNQLDFDGISLGGVTIALGETDATPAFDLSDATNYPTSSLVGTITNAQLAGSIANAKLANSTISGVALGSNLNSLSAGNGLSMTAYDGSAAVSDLTIDLNGSSLTVTGDGLAINAGGVGTSELAATSVTEAKLASNAVTNGKIADTSITMEKLDFGGFFAAFDADGSTLAFELAGAVDLGFAESYVVTVNGLVIEYKATPDAQDNYKIDNNGTGDVGRIVFGSNLSNGDRVTIRAFINN